MDQTSEERFKYLLEHPGEFLEFDEELQAWVDKPDIFGIISHYARDRVAKVISCDSPYFGPAMQNMEAELYNTWAEFVVDYIGG